MLDLLKGCYTILIQGPKTMILVGHHVDLNLVSALSTNPGATTGAST